MRGFKKFLALLGRLLISILFILSAVNKIFDWEKTESGLINLFCDWQSYANFSTLLAKFFSSLISWAPEILIVITIIELIGALLVFFGIKERFGAFLLIIFFIPATILLHPFWFLSGAKRYFELVLFLKNLAILGGLLFLMVFGTKIKDDANMSQPQIPKPDYDDEE
ncbi:MAG: hypothetical protein K940chlam1_00212 [Candidatus Anoxychlamydiales bacterium]|nr:hypothetical protein [Candidatus Anoxychlamydiales bacterium]NGX36084.1 hypothetical protein [Candidatus Anoxychlamydiales bacterium]